MHADVNELQESHNFIVVNCNIITNILHVFANLTSFIH